MSLAKHSILIILLTTFTYLSCSDDKSSSSSNDLHGIQFVGKYNTPDQAVGVIVEGNFAYVADHDSGMQIINIANPAQPAFGGHYQCPGALQIDLKGSTAYIADESLYSLEIVDISNPGTPGFVGRFDGFEVLGIRLFGNYAIMGCGSDGLLVVDVTNSSNPVPVGDCQEVSLLRLELYGNYVLVPGENSYKGLYLVSLSDLANPDVIGSVPTQGWPYEVAAQNSYAYMTSLNMFNPLDTGYLYIIDISNTASPQKIDSLFLGTATVADFIRGDYLYVTFANADETSGFHIYDISTPATPELIATHLINVMPWDIWVENEYIYIAADTAGLMIFRYYP
jgi:hypothetical protein